MSHATFIVNVEAVIRDGKRYLMARRSQQEQHAPGGLTFAGGKVEPGEARFDVLEETARREIREELGVEVRQEITFLYSSAFAIGDGMPVIDVVFLCRYQSGEPQALQPDEVAAVQWMTAQEIYAQPTLAPWTRHAIEMAERIL